MAGSLGGLVIELAANTARLSSDMGKAVGIVERGSRTMSNAFKLIGGAGIVGTLTSIVNRSIEVGDNLNKAAIKAGIGGRAMSELAYAAKTVDVELSGLSTSLRFMQKSLSEAGSGSKPAQQSLAALGLTFKDLKGLAADKQFEIIADRINLLVDPADKARAATELFGRAGADLLPLFEQGAAGIRKAREEAQKLGQSFSEQQIKKLAEADDAVKRLKASWESFAVSLSSKVAPAISIALDIAAGNFKTGLSLEDLGVEQVRKLLEKAQRAKPSPKRDETVALYEGRLRELLAVQNAANAARGSAPGGAPGYSGPAAQDQSLTEIVVEGSRIRLSAMTEYYRSLDDLTKTSAERQLAKFEEIELGLKTLRDAGIISAETFSERWTEAFRELVPEIEVTAKKIGELAEKREKDFDDLAGYAQSAAYRAEDSFRRFFFDPVETGIKGLGKDLVDTLRHAIADGFSDFLFRPKNEGGIGLRDIVGSGIAGLGSLLGFASGGSFKVGGSGGTDSQLVAFKATPGETVDVRTPGQRRGGGFVVNINNNVDARGATQDVIRALPAVMAANNRQLEESVIRRMHALVNGGTWDR